jgi:hypothetical protein
MTIGYDSRGIHVEGHQGTWYVIETGEHNGDSVYLLEHEEFGDEAACVIVDTFGNLLLEDVHNGLAELDY